jgi:hypothetical protein
MRLAFLHGVKGYRQNRVLMSRILSVTNWVQRIVEAYDKADVVAKEERAKTFGPKRKMQSLSNEGQRVFSEFF